MSLSYHQLEEETFNFLYKKHLSNPSFTFSTRKKFIPAAKDDYFIGTSNSKYFAFTLWYIPVWYPGASVDLLDFVVVTNRNEPYFYFQYYMYKNVNETQNRLNLSFFDKLKSTLDKDFNIQVYEAKKQKKIYWYPAEGGNIGFFTSLNKFINDIASKVDLAINEFKNNHNNWSAQRISEEDFDQHLLKLSEKLGLNFTANIEELIEGQENKEEERILENPELPETEKETVTKSRIGQSIFRDNLISLWGHCAISRYNKVELLRASHIKPWRVCDNTERIDMFNGLLLMPNYDLLFDKYLITFTDDGVILISNKLTRRDREILKLSNDIKIDVKKENIKYLSYHREQFYLNESIS